MGIMLEAPSSMEPGKRMRGGLLLLVLILLEAVLLGALVAGHRMVRGHDGLQYFGLQYWFLSGAATAGEIPQWMPFMTQGTVGNWPLLGQASICQSVLLLGGSLWKGAQFLPFFYLGIFFDEMVLLVGMWLLSGRYFISAQTRFFVGAAVMGSCIWMDQPWFNFHFYYALPLLLHLLHCFLESGRWRHALFAGNLLAVQMLGNMPYMIPVTTLVIFIYFAAWTVLVDRVPWREKKLVRHPFRGLWCVALIGLVFGLIYTLMKHGTADIVTYNIGRERDQSTSLSGFLTYAGSGDCTMWLETVLGVSPAMDYTLYFGTFSLLFVVLGAVYGRDRRAWVLWCVTILLALFSFGGFFAYACYRLWPMMKFYRHVLLVCVLTKPFLCLLAGFGFEACVLKRVERKWPLLVVGAMTCFLAAWLLHLSWNPKASADLLGHIPPRDSLGLKTFMDPVVTANSLALSAGWSFIAALLVIGLTLRTSERARAVVITLVLLAQVLNEYTYKTVQAYSRTFSMNKFQYEANRFQPIPWQARRHPNPWRNARTEAFFSQLLETRYGTYNCALGSYLFSDTTGSAYRVDNWLLPLDDFMRAFWKQPLRAFHLRPNGLPTSQQLEFPSDHIACQKFSGLVEDKLQVFRQAHEPGSDLIILESLTSPRFLSDALFLSKMETGDPSLPSDIPPPSSNERLGSSVQVMRYDANHLDVTVQTDATGHTGPLWLFYSDVWHPFWSATVDGKPVEVRRACIAYKAVPIHAGKSFVQFHFGSRLNQAVFLVLALNSALWFAAVIVLLVRAVFRPEVPAGRIHASHEYVPSPWTPMIRLRVLSVTLLVGMFLMGLLLVTPLWRNELLLVAAGKGHNHVAKVLLALHADINVHDSQGVTPLDLAVSQKRSDMVRDLLRHGADPKAGGLDVATLLLKAVKDNEAGIARDLIEAGADVNTVAKDGSSPLHYAAWSGNVELARLLLTRSPNVDATNQGKRTPLMCAAWQGNADLVQLLLAHKADPNLVDENGWTALKCAKERGFTAIVEALKAAGARS